MDQSKIKAFFLTLSQTKLFVPDYSLTHWLLELFARNVFFGHFSLRTKRFCNLEPRFPKAGHISRSNRVRSGFEIKVREQRTGHGGRVPFDQNFRKSRFKIEWNRHFPEIRFENFGSPLEVVRFSGNLEIPEISSSICRFYPVLNRPPFLWLWKATRWRRVFRVDTLLDAKWSAIVRACSWSLHENVRIWYPGKLWTGRSEFFVCKFARFAYYPSRKVRKFNSLTRKSWILNACLTSLHEAPYGLRATSSRSFSILSSNSWWEMCSSGKRMRSVRPGGKYRSIRHTKISEIQTGIFGRMERARTFWAVFRLDFGQISLDLVENALATRQLAVLSTSITF